MNINNLFESIFKLFSFISCYDGFTGALCQIEINECRSAPCQNGGTCLQPYPNLYTCLCPEKFGGPQCLIPIDSCNLNMKYKNQINSYFISYHFRSWEFL